MNYILVIMFCSIKCLAPQKDPVCLQRYLISYSRRSYSQMQYTQKKSSIKDLLSKRDQICSFSWICSHLLKESLNRKTSFFCAVCSSE